MEFTVEGGMRILPESSWRPVLQRSIDAFYEGRKDEGIEACLTLLQAPGLPEDIRELTFRNQSFYAQPLEELVEGAQWTVQEVPGLDDWEFHDPSPFLAGDQLMVFLRTAPAEGGQACTHVLLTLDDEYDAAEMTIIGDETGEAELFHGVRPFFADSALQSSVILRGPRGDSPVRAGIVDLVSGTWQNLRCFGPRAGQFKVGLSPVVTEAGVHCVSWWEPTEVFRHDLESSEFERVALRMSPHIAERFQDGSQGVRVPGGFLFLINERVTFDGEQPLIFSRFVRIDEQFQISGISPQFFVNVHGQSLASGLARLGNRLIAGFSFARSQPLLATLDLAATLTTLIPLDAPGRRATPRLDSS